MKRNSVIAVLLSSVLLFFVYRFFQPRRMNFSRIMRRLRRSRFMKEMVRTVVNQFLRQLRFVR